MNNVVTEDKDKDLEEEKIKSALSRYGYPKWAFKQVKDKMENKQVKKKNNKKDTTKKSKDYMSISLMLKALLRKPRAFFADMT